MTAGNETYQNEANESPRDLASGSRSVVFLWGQLGEELRTKIAKSGMVHDAAKNKKAST